MHRDVRTRSCQKIGQGLSLFRPNDRVLTAGSNEHPYVI
jgi:hypothetical protein